MKTRAIFPGLKNSQKVRFILTANSGEEVGMTLTIQQLSDQFATKDARVSVYSALAKLAADRKIAKDKGDTLPTGLVVGAQGFRQVQIDLH